MMSPSTWDRGRLVGMGFEGFLPLDRAAVMAPQAPGVYAVLRESDAPPEFVTTSRGGWFKERNPATAIEILVAKWVDGADLLYIGQGVNLRRRLSQLNCFGQGVAVGHWGGRYLWQLADSARFVVGWQCAEDPLGAEATLIGRFAAELGCLPFANLRL
jgi:hypothetical protein